MVKRRDWMYKQKGKRAKQLAALLYLERFVPLHKMIWCATTGICPMDDEEDVLYPHVVRIWELWKTERLETGDSWKFWYTHKLKQLLRIDEEIRVDSIIYATRLYTAAVQNLYFVTDRQNGTCPLTDKDWMQISD